MKVNTDPLRLDLAVLAAAGSELAGQAPAGRFSRLMDLASPASPDRTDDVHWTARGEQRPRHAAPPEVWLHLKARAQVVLTCQRCLGALDHTLEVDRPLRFVASEAEAEVLDAESEEDVLELPRFLNLLELIEDELLLALPLVPMHEHCPAPLIARHDAPAATEAPAEHPFAALKAWKAPGTEH